MDNYILSHTTGSLSENIDYVLFLDILFIDENREDWLEINPNFMECHRWVLIQLFTSRVKLFW